MAITFVGAGTVTHGNYNTTAAPPLPAGTVAGDLLLCCSYLRSNGTLTSTWATHVSNDGSSTYILISYKIATGGDAAPTITPVTALTGQHYTSSVLAFRGVDPITPFGTPGTAAQYASAANIGPVAAATAVVADGAVVVVGCRNDANTEDPTISVLSGDGLTWFEACEGSSIDNASHLVVDYAIWAGAAPTLTAKTFTVSASTAAVSAGVMLLLRPLTTVGVSFVGLGQRDVFGHAETTGIPLPSGLQNGDLLFLVSYLMNAGTLSVSAGWTEYSLADTTVNGGSFYMRTWYKFVSGAQTEPDITVNSGSTSPQSLGQAFIYALRGMNQSTPFGTAGADSFNVSAINIGPIAAPLIAPQTGVAIVIGHRNGPEFTTAGTLTGDGLTWTKDFENSAFTLNGQSFASAGYHSVWNTSAPTLTAKTIVPGVSTTGPGFGKMFVLSGVEFSGVQEKTASVNADAAAIVAQTISYSADVSVVATGGIWTGTSAVGDHDDVMTPGLPAGLLNGDLLLTVGYLRSNGTLSISPSGSWTQRGLIDTVQFGSGFYLQSWYCIYDGTQTAPTISVTGGGTSPQTLTVSCVMAARGVNPVTPFGSDGADSFNAVGANIGPIAAPLSLPSSGAALVIGVRNSAPWTSMPALSGDGLTWIEAFDLGHTVAGLGTAVVADYATWTGSPPTITAKTFTPTGGAGGVGMGKMLVLNYVTAQERTVSASADVSVIAITIPVLTASADVVVVTATTRVAGADAYVTALSTQTRTVSADAIVLASSTTRVVAVDAVVAAGATKILGLFADVNIAPAAVFRTIITFADVVVNPPLVQPDAAVSAVAELSAESTDTAWLVLLKIDHPDLQGQPILVTNDAVPTISNGLVFSPFPFSAILPDDVEGRPPQAQLQIDNTTQEIIAVLRGLITPPTLTIQIVRSINPDIVEYEWVGLEWSASSYDKNTITGTLSMIDLTEEEFPYVTYDSRWRGLWP